MRKTIRRDRCGPYRRYGFTALRIVLGALAAVMLFLAGAAVVRSVRTDRLNSRLSELHDASREETDPQNSQTHNHPGAGTAVILCCIWHWRQPLWRCCGFCGKRNRPGPEDCGSDPWPLRPVLKSERKIIFSARIRFIFSLPAQCVRRRPGTICRARQASHQERTCLPWACGSGYRRGAIASRIQSLIDSRFSMILTFFLIS